MVVRVRNRRSMALRVKVNDAPQPSHGACLEIWFGTFKEKYEMAPERWNMRVSAHGKLLFLKTFTVQSP